MSEKLKTSDGYFTVEQLHKGAIDQIAWMDGPLTHTVTLRCTRITPDPPLYCVEHLTTDASRKPMTMKKDSELFDDVRQARNAMRGIRRKHTPKS